MVVKSLSFHLIKFCFSVCLLFVCLSVCCVVVVGCWSLMMVCFCFLFLVNVGDGDGRGLAGCHRCFLLLL